VTDSPPKPELEPDPYDGECPECGGDRFWCDICEMWSAVCCWDYGTCHCD
jgi:hypothetical protein